MTEVKLLSGVGVSIMGERTFDVGGRNTERIMEG